MYNFFFCNFSKLLGRFLNELKNLSISPHMCALHMETIQRKTTKTQNGKNLSIHCFPKNSFIDIEDLGGSAKILKIEIKFEIVELKLIIFKR